MSDTTSRPFVDTLRKGLRWLKGFEEAMDFSMDDHLLRRIEGLERVVSALEARIDGLMAGRPALSHADTAVQTKLDVY